MYDIITIGGATRDITFLTDKGKVIETPENLTEQALLCFEHGAKIRSDEIFLNFGSGGCNSAVTFAKLGFKVAVNCRIGKDDEGKTVINNLKERGINTDLVQVDENNKTGFSFVVLNKKDGDRVIFVYKGASDFIEINVNEIGNAKWLYLASIAGDWKEDLKEINKAVENNDIKLAWNPGATQISAGKAELENTLKNTEILIVNKDEAIELVQSDEKIKLDFNEITDTKILLTILKKWGPKNVIVTDGPEGAYIYDGEKILYAPATSKIKVDSTGAGDSFGSALVAGYMQNENIGMALRYGVLNSGNVVGEYGAQNGILSKDEIEKRLDEVKVSYL